MVRPYYQGRDWERFLAEIARDYPTLSEIHTARLADQTSLIKNARDILSLKRALVAFSSLQQIKLLRLQDRADEDIMERARRLGPVRDVKLDWEPACSRAIEGLALALMESSCQSVRFLGPQLSPEAALKLLNAPRVAMSALGERLTCLDIYFHSASDVTALMSKLSTTFRDFFQAARNLKTFSTTYIGHDYGVLGFKAGDYIRLKSAQSRGVISRSLENYVYQIMNGIEISPGSTTDEDEQREEDDDDDTNHNGGIEPPQSDTDSSSILSIHDSQSEISSETEESYRQQHRYPYHQHHQNQRDLQSLSEQELSMLTANDLGDNGIYVKREHWHIWEKWPSHPTLKQIVRLGDNPSPMPSSTAATPDSNINHASSLAYWSNIPPTVNGMLGGFPQVSRIDLRGSANFLAKIRRLLQTEQDESNKETEAGQQSGRQARKSKKLKRGVDCGAGIGRVTDGFLRNVCETVDVVEPVGKFADVIRQGPLVRRKKTTPPIPSTTETNHKTSEEIEKAEEEEEEEEEEEGVIENIYITGLESWLPTEKYDLIWNQWCVGHLTNAQLTTYLQRAADALTPSGILVLKENNSTDPDGKDIYDEVDSSVTRTDETFRRIFKDAGLNLIKTEEQLGFPRHLGLLPVRSYALRPVRRS
ncbi:Hypothetical protein PENO1_088550 [Penicillium occitanis (nom. inval.)]|nr:Hypothetical protein PENO1_088550 [Penicillium occitanis (nom. inval.)]PCG95925.1 hypothetical protein PENOC_075200 [Penicillium occitanis (nom. inval.)]